jgi:hypothetical protein
MKGMFPLELMQVMSEGAEQVQGAANGFGTLLECTIRIDAEHDGEPSFILRYGIEPAVAGSVPIWTIEYVPTEAVPE